LLQDTERAGAPTPKSSLFAWNEPSPLPSRTSARGARGTARSFQGDVELAVTVEVAHCHRGPDADDVGGDWADRDSGRDFFSQRLNQDSAMR
jgi:hypothetical protein